MKYFFISVFVLPLFLGASGKSFGSFPEQEEPVNAAPDLPVIVRKNQGQWDEKILYKGSTSNTSVSFLQDQVSFGFSRVVEKKVGEALPSPASVIQSEVQEYLVWNLHFDGMNSKPELVAEGEQESKTNYILKNKTFTNVPDYAQLTYKNIYDKIDLRYYALEHALKYDFIIKPGGDLNKISLQCDGIKSLSVNPKGELELLTAWGIQTESTPFAYQWVNGEKKKIDVRFFISNEHTFGFKAYQNYDRALELIIDPVVLDWATYMSGKSNSTNGYQFDLTTDAAGFVYGTGYNNNSFPTTPGSYSTAYSGDSGNPLAINGAGDVFVYKLNQTGSALIYSTYIGGSNDEAGRGIQVNAAGEAFVTGVTVSYDFPTQNPLQPFIKGLIDAFVFKLNASGTNLIFSTYLGGTSNDWGFDIAINNAGESFITGSTNSSDFPVSAGAFQTNWVYNTEVFVARLDASGANLLYATFVGQNGYSMGYGIAVDATNNAYVTGVTDNTNFPTTPGSFDVTANGGQDAFILKLNPGGTGLIYSTYLGGSGNDAFGGAAASYYSYGLAITLNAAGEAFVTGGTQSANFPVTAGAYSTTLKGTGDAYIAHIDASGSSLLYSTFMGGVGQEHGYDIVVTGSDEVFVSGTTNSNDFPTTPCAFDASYNGGMSDVFLLKLNAAGNKLIYSTYYGGNDADYSDPSIGLIKKTCTTEIVVGFTTHSWNLPTTAGSLQPKATTTQFADDQPTLFKLKPKIKPGFTMTPTKFCGTPVTFTDTTSQCGLWDTLTVHHWDFGDGTVADGISVTHSYTVAGTYNPKLIVGCPMDSASKTLTITTGIFNTTIGTTPSACTATTGTASITVGGGTSPYAFQWNTTPTQSGQTATGLAAGTYVVTITDKGGCTATTTATIIDSNSPTVTINSAIDPLCNAGKTGSAIAVPAGGTGPFTYSWSNGQTAATATALSGITYVVTVTDANGCKQSQTITLNDPPAIQGPSFSTTKADCGLTNGSAIASASGGTGTLTYTWGNTTSGATSTGLAPGNYLITIIDGNGCTKDSTVTVGAKGGPVTNTNVYSAIACNGGKGSVTAVVVSGGSSPYTYSWSSGTSITSAATQQGLGNLTTGIYSVTVIDGTGCSSSSSINLSEPAVLAITPLSISAVCGNTNGSATVSISGGTPVYSYSWSNATTGTATGTTTTLKNLSPGTYTVTITDSQGCLSTSSVTINNVVPATINVTPAQQTVVQGSSVNLLVSGAATYTWSPAIGLSCTVCPNPIATPTATTTYTIDATDINGCTVTAQITISVKAPCVGDEKDIFIANVFSPNNDGINDVVYVEGTGLVNIYWAIYDRWGNLLFETSNQNEGWDGTHKSNPLGTGTYVYYLKATCVKTNTEIRLKGNISLVK